MKLYLWGITLLHYKLTVKCSESSKVDLTITIPITLNNFCNSIAESRVGFSHLQGDTPYAFPIITGIMLYAVFRSCSPCFFSSLHPGRSASSWQGRMFYIYFRIISHEFTSASLRNSCGSFFWFLTGIPLILFRIKI